MVLSKDLSANRKLKIQVSLTVLMHIRKTDQLRLAPRRNSARKSVSLNGNVTFFCTKKQDAPDQVCDATGAPSTRMDRSEGRPRPIKAAVYLRS